MADPLRRHKYAFNRILIPAARILSPEFNAVYIFLTGSHVEILRNLLDYANRENTFVDEYHDGYYLSPDATDWDSIGAIVAELELMLMGTVLGFYDAYVCVRDVKAQNMNGGTFTVGAWRTRDINNEQADAQGICSISTNQIVLAPGTYRCIISAPAYRVGYHQLRLYNVSDSGLLLTGTSEQSWATDSCVTRSLVVGRFTVGDSKSLEIQHQCYATCANEGFGRSNNFGEEVYAVAEFWRET